MSYELIYKAIPNNENWIQEAMGIALILFFKEIASRKHGHTAFIFR